MLQGVSPLPLIFVTGESAQHIDAPTTYNQFDQRRSRKSPLVNHSHDE